MKEILMGITNITIQCWIIFRSAILFLVEIGKVTLKFQIVWARNLINVTLSINTHYTKMTVASLGIIQHYIQNLIYFLPNFKNRLLL